MKLTEYLFNEYRESTNKYVAASQRLRKLLPRMANLSKKEELPTKKATKELVLELDKTEEEIETALAKLRDIRHRLLELL